MLKNIYFCTIKQEMKRDDKVPFFNLMSNEEQILNYLNQIILDTDCYLVNYKITPKNNYKFYLDTDEGIKLENCIRINRKLRFLIDEAALYPDGDYSLELSSPGIEHPLNSLRQYTKNINRLVEISFNAEEKKPIVGRLKSVTDEQIELEITDKKKKTTTIENILLADIKQTLVQIEF